MSAEFHLVRILVMKPPSKWIPYTKEYPFIFDYEWSIEGGFGDLIYTDGCDNFLIVEVKSMSTGGKASTMRNRNRNKRNEGKEQTKKYRTLWREKNPQVNTTGIFVTDAKSEDGTEWQVKPIEC